MLCLGGDDCNLLRQLRVNAESFGSLAEALVSCPQKRGGIEKDTSDQVCVGQADAKAVQVASLDHEPHFAELRHLRLRQEVQQGECLGALLQGTKCKLRNDEGMDHDLSLVQKPAQLFVPRAKVVDPDGRIGENQCGRTLVFAWVSA